MDGGKDPGDGRFNYNTGDHMLLSGELGIVEAKKIAIDLNNCNPYIARIYQRPRSIGFDFYPENARLQLKAVRDCPVLHEDDPATIAGKFMGSNSKGMRFRQEGSGKSIHFIIWFSNVCNEHIDAVGLRDTCGYDAMRALGHGYWDLAPDKVPRRSSLLEKRESEA